jgi:hypothetical protein
MPSDPNVDGPVSAGFALIHDTVGQYPMELEDGFMRDALAGTVSLDVAEAGEVVDHLAPRAGDGSRGFRPVRERANLFQCQWVALYRRGGMDVACPAVLLQRRNPGQFDGGVLDALPQPGDLLDDG